MAARLFCSRVSSSFLIKSPVMMSKSGSMGKPSIPRMAPVATVLATIAFAPESVASFTKGMSRN